MSSSSSFVDKTRFFQNPDLGSDALSIEQLTAEECRAIAVRLFHQCIRHQDSPSSSVGSLYAGDSGSKLYLRWRLAKAFESASDGSIAKTLRNEALEIARKAEASIASFKVRCVSLLEGREVGFRAMLAILIHWSGETSESMRAVDKLVEQMIEASRSLPASECDVLYGRSGAIQAILFLRRELSMPSLATETVVELARDIVREGRSYAEKHPEHQFPLLWKWHDSVYLGAAHGMVGILSTLLSLSSEEQSLLNKETNFMALVRASIHRLNAYCWESGNLKSSIKDRHSVDRLVQWCHGAPGHILLLAKAAEVYGDNALLRRATDIADNVIWPRGLLRKGVGLCHGITGNAYALLLLSKHDSSFLIKAKSFALFALDRLDELERVPDDPYSLYGGLAGLSALFIDLADPQRATFPLYM